MCMIEQSGQFWSSDFSRTVFDHVSRPVVGRRAAVFVALRLAAIVGRTSAPTFRHKSPTRTGARRLGVPSAARDGFKPRRQITDRSSYAVRLDKRLFVGGVKLPLALAELGLIDEYEFVIQPRLAGHGPTLFAGLSKHVDLKLVSRLEFGSGAVAMRYEPRR